ncbi:MAG: beta-ketoacyl synthase chain length factor [Flavipsychrobacter sp.]
MMKPVYIRSARSISPQHSFDANFIAEQPENYTTGKLFVIDPNYRDYINPVAIRRMSRLLKMGISSGMRALQDAELEKPDGIITGTGRGSMSDTEIFTKDIIKYKEEALNPTYFIQSTYNSINGWIALQTKSIGYNQTYVHRSNSLALALLDAQMLLNETDDTKHYLVGCFDELTDEYTIVKSKINYWKKETINSLELLQHSHTAGTIPGEGAAFFTITNNAQQAEATLLATVALEDPDTTTLQNTISKILADNNIGKEDIDVLLTGRNGDVDRDDIYTPIENELGTQTTICAYKHLCGEYDTSVGFALWLATKMLVKQQIPASIVVKNVPNERIRYILIVNQYILKGTSILLLKQP